MPNDTLLFLHVLSAFLLMTTVVVLSAGALGSQLNALQVRLANLFWDIGGLGTLVFGIWLALDTDPYGLGDGWIIVALVLWVAATGVGVRVRQAIAPAGAAPVEAVGWTDQVVLMHWARVGIVIVLLADMILKPGAG